MERAAWLQLEHVGVRFGGLKVLSDLSLSFGDRPIHCIIGPNGAGKTTLFNVLTGAVTPNAGRVLCGGEDITGLAPYEVAKRGIVRKFQVPSVFRALTVEQNLLIAVRAPRRDRQRPDRTESSLRVDETLAQLGLEDRRKDIAGSLSHGELQWLEIGMALVADARAVLLDEPTAGLGPEETQRTVALVRLLAEQRTVLVIEHDMHFIRDLESEVTVLHQGTVLRRGPMSEIEADHVVRDVYLGRAAHA